jgi:nucleoside 2-deoxyribosyltransferase
MKIYIASPLGFSEIGRQFYEGRVIPAVVRLGHTVLDPWKLTSSKRIAAVNAMRYGVEKRNKWRRLNAEIGNNNRAAIDKCDAVLAVLDGVDVDSGTASEIGYAFAKGKPILGYRGDFRLSADNEGFTSESSGGILHSPKRRSNHRSICRPPKGSEEDCCLRL